MPMAAPDSSPAEAALECLSSADPPQYLSPSPELSRTAREASAQLYSVLVPRCPKGKAPPLDRLLTDDAFDAEQIWQQIDLLSRPLLSLLSRQLTLLQRRTPRVTAATFPAPVSETKPREGDASIRGSQADSKDDEDEDEDGDGDEEMEGLEVGDEEVDDDDDDDEEEGEEDDQQEEKLGVEDEFLKIKELEDYLEKGEREYGNAAAKEKKEEDDDEDEDEENDDDEVGGAAGLEVSSFLLH